MSSVFCILAKVFFCVILLVRGDSMAKTSSAVKNKYNAKAYDRITIVIKKTDMPRLKEYVESKGMTMSGYIKELISKDSGIDV